MKIGERERESALNEDLERERGGLLMVNGVFECGRLRLSHGKEGREGRSCFALLILGGHG